MVSAPSPPPNSDGTSSDGDGDGDSTFLKVLRGDHAAPRDTQSTELVSLLPGQEYSAAEKSIRLSFARTTPVESSSICDTQSSPPLVVTLSVDASPGCGGIVWPAGQVREISALLYHLSHTAMCGD